MGIEIKTGAAFERRLAELAWQSSNQGDGKRTPGELLLGGGMATFKGIPVIAELNPEDELIVE